MTGRNTKYNNQRFKIKMRSSGWLEGEKKRCQEKIKAFFINRFREKMQALKEKEKQMDEPISSGEIDSLISNDSEEEILTQQELEEDLEYKISLMEYKEENNNE